MPVGPNAPNQEKESFGFAVSKDQQSVSDEAPLCLHTTIVLRPRFERLCAPPVLARGLHRLSSVFMVGA